MNGVKFLQKNHQKNLVIFGIPLLMIGLMIILAKSSIFTHNPNSLAIGITLDLLITVPLVYFLLIRKTNIPKITVASLSIIGFFICTIMLPTENQYFLNLFKKWVLPVVEISILIFVIYEVRKVIKKYKLNKTKSFDFFTTLKKTCSEIFPKRAAILVVSEIAVIYYGFIYWKKRELKENEFSYHKESGTISLLFAIILIVIIETVVLHILIAKWSSITAWVITSLSIYSGLQIFGFLKSMLKRPIAITNDRLYLRYGIMSESVIDLKEIEKIEIVTNEIALTKETRKLSFLGDLESHNIIIRLKKENKLIGYFGIERKYRNLVLHVDKKTEFIDRINSRLEQF